MARVTYVTEALGAEMEAPSGYYVPREEAFLEHEGKRLLYILGTMCIEASCCGIGRWDYVRVHGYVADTESETSAASERSSELQIDTIEDVGEKQSVVKQLLVLYPDVRVEFR